jgi:hypothetical protein
MGPHFIKLYLSNFGTKLNLFDIIVFIYFAAQNPGQFDRILHTA